MIDEKSHLWIKDIGEKDNVKGCYLVKEKRIGTTRRGDPFLTLTIADRSGELIGKVWEEVEQISSLFSEGDIIEVEGYAASYRGQIQLTVSGLKALSEEVDPSIFFETAAGDPIEMMQSLKEILKDLKNKHLKRLVERFLADRQFVFLFKQSPAAKHFHHSYSGGLLEHTLSVCRLVTQIAGHYPQLDRDLLMTGAFLHDIGKIRELKFDGQIDYTDEGRLIGHVVLGAAMVDEKLKELQGFPHEVATKLKHLILSHHGQYEFGSPKRPKFLEAVALHLIDDLDAKITGIGRFMEKDRQGGAWTDFNRLFDRFFLKGKILPVEEEQDKEGEIEERQKTLW